MTETDCRAFIGVDWDCENWIYCDPPVQCSIAANPNQPNWKIYAEAPGHNLVLVAIRRGMPRAAAHWEKLRGQKMQILVDNNAAIGEGAAGPAQPIPEQQPIYIYANPDGFATCREAGEISVTLFDSPKSPGDEPQTVAEFLEAYPTLKVKGWVNPSGDDNGDYQNVALNGDPANIESNLIESNLIESNLIEALNSEADNRTNSLDGLLNAPANYAGATFEIVTVSAGVIQVTYNGPVSTSPHIAALDARRAAFFRERINNVLTNGGLPAADIAATDVLPLRRVVCPLNAKWSLHIIFRIPSNSSSSTGYDLDNLLKPHVDGLCAPRHSQQLPANWIMNDPLNCVLDDDSNIYSVHAEKVIVGDGQPTGFTAILVQMP